MGSYADGTFIIKMDELRDLIQEEFGKAIEKVLTKNTAPIPLSIQDVMERYGVSKVTVHNWIKKGQIKGFKKGKKRYFHLKELEDCYEITVRHHDALEKKGLVEPYPKYR